MRWIGVAVGDTLADVIAMDEQSRIRKAKALIARPHPATPEDPRPGVDPALA